MSLYQRVDGVPQLRDSLVAYLDVLGIQQAYHQDADTTAAVLDRALQTALHFASLQPAAGGGFAGSAVHDSVTLGMPWDQPSASLVAAFAVEALQLLQASLTVVQQGHLNGLFTRGAIASGSHFIDDRFVGGLALARAVAAEGARDGNPWRDRPVVRVLPEALVRLPLNAPGPMGALAWCDGEAFVNYLAGFAVTPATPGSFVAADDPELAEALARHGQLLRDNLRSATDATRPKYRWLLGYHNAFCRRLELDNLQIDTASSSAAPQPQPGEPGANQISFDDPRDGAAAGYRRRLM